MNGISVVIPAFNGGRLLDEQLAALRNQEFTGDWELVVADNGSTDATVAVAERWAGCLPLRVVTVLERGVNAARNGGVAVTTYSKLAFLDQDDRATPAWLDVMDRALDHFPLVGGRLDYMQLNDKLVVAGRVQQPAKAELPRYQGVAHAFGANMGCRRDVFDEVGGFDPEFRSGGDDVDFCFRAHLCGIETTFVQEAVVAYRLRATRREYRQQMHRYAVMDAQMAAKHRRSGAIARQSARSRAAAAWGHVTLLSAINLWFTPVGRWHYAHRVGNATGAAVGYLRHGQLVL